MKILHDFYRGEEEEFVFDLKDSARKGHSFKDVICPYAPKFNHKDFKFGERYGRVLISKQLFKIYQDNFISELCDLNRNLVLIQWI